MILTLDNFVSIFLLFLEGLNYECAGGGNLLKKFKRFYLLFFIILIKKFEIEIINLILENKPVFSPLGEILLNGGVLMTF